MALLYSFMISDQLVVKRSSDSVCGALCSLGLRGRQGAWSGHAASDSNRKRGLNEQLTSPKAPREDSSYSSRPQPD